MTVHANSLTERVTHRADAVGSWTIPANDLRVLTDALGRLGYDVHMLLASAGLRETDLTDPDERIPCEVYGMLVASAQQKRFTPNLALEKDTASFSVQHSGRSTAA